MPAEPDRHLHELPETGIPVGRLAPSIPVKSSRNGIDELEWGKRQGAALVLFLTSACRACETALKDLDRAVELAAHNSEKEIVVIDVEPTRLNPLRSRKVVKMPGLNFYEIESSDMPDVRIHFHVSAAPSYCYLDPDGHVLASGRIDDQYGEIVAGMETGG